MARYDIQADWDWPECTRFTPLGGSLAGLLGTASALVVPGWEYVYSRPTGCIAFRGVVGNEVNANTGTWQEYPYLEVGDQIACNVYNDDADDPTYLFRYTLQVTDPTKWSPGLFQATAHLLAIYLARPNGVNQEGQAYLRNLFKDAYDKARASCQRRAFVPGHLAMPGTSVELAPGVIDYKFPQPE